MLINEWIKAWEDRVPLKLQEEWDNSGRQAGRFESQLKSIVFSLDLTKEAVKKAKEVGANLIFTHHPPIFRPLKNICSDNNVSELIISCLEEGISVYSAHTSFDFVDGGVNWILADLLEMKDCRPLRAREESDPLKVYSEGLGRLGRHEIISLAEYAKKMSKKFKKPLISYGPGDKRIEKIACLGGAGASFIGEAIDKGADLLVTADIKYHEAQDALRSGLALIDLAHDVSEDPAMDRAVDISKEINPDIICYRIYADEVERTLY